jgi:hypothetical protein
MQVEWGEGMGGGASQGWAMSIGFLLGCARRVRAENPFFPPPLLDHQHTRVRHGQSNNAGTHTSEGSQVALGKRVHSSAGRVVVQNARVTTSDKEEFEAGMCSIPGTAEQVHDRDREQGGGG